MTHFLQRTSLIALAAAGALGACTTTPVDAPRPNFPIRNDQATAPAPAATPAPVDDSPVQARPAAPVESRPLEPLQTAPAQTAPAPSAPTTTAPATTAPADQPVTAAQPSTSPPPAAPAFRTVTTRSVTGRVVDVDGPAETYEVQKGDNLAKIARKLGTTVEQLREDNDLGRNETIRPGQELKGPRSSAKAYVVGQGDTLFAIARRFGLTADNIAEENKIGRNASLRVGQRLVLPAGFNDRGPIVTTSRVAVDSAASAASPPTTPVRASAAAPAPVQAEPDDEPAPPVAPAFTTTTRRTVTGRVVDVEGPPVTYTVKKGDSLEKIADKLGTTVQDLKDDNKLKRSTIQPGQELKGPRTTARAYVAGSGDTLAGVARRFGVSVEALREENDLARNATLRSGQRVRLPKGFRDRGPITETVRTPVARPASPPPAAQPVRTQAPAPQPSTTETPPVSTAPAQPPSATPPVSRPAAQPAQPTPTLPAAPQPYRPPAQTAPRPSTPPVAAAPVQPRPSQPAPSTSGPPLAPSNTGPLSDAQISDLARGRFIWPLQGQIVSDFGPKGGGQRNDGINIAAQTGAPVRAAAAGDVVYAGDQVPGFGNLVLIKHPDGWVTAYGHLSRVEVKMTQKVTQGQQIGLAGSTGGVPQPQLHFEVRYAPSPLERARPIDPKLALPR
jgi:murein DD-endopeptidase MepM/ murein hydrolase activator NlpD